MKADAATQTPDGGNWATFPYRLAMAVIENPRHELFAQAIAKGDTGRDAYKAAGFGPKTDASADAGASRLLRDVKGRSPKELLGEMAELAKIDGARVLGMNLPTSPSPTCSTSSRSGRMGYPYRLFRAHPRAGGGDRRTCCRDHPGRGGQ